MKKKMEERAGTRKKTMPGETLSKQEEVVVPGRGVFVLEPGNLGGGQL